MSVKAITWAFEQQVGDPGIKVLLLALADYADEDNVTWRRRAILAERVEVSERTITRYIQRLMDMGLVTVEQRKLDNGANSTNFYKLRLDRQLPLVPPGQIGSAPETPAVPAPETTIGSTPETTGVSTIYPSSKPSNKSSIQGALVAERPDWLPAEWDAFVADRKERRKPLSTRAAAMAMNELAALRAAGQDPAAVLLQSIRKGWAGLFAVKEEPAVGATLADRNRAAAEAFKREHAEEANL